MLTESPFFFVLYGPPPTRDDQAGFAYDYDKGLMALSLSKVKTSPKPWR